MVKVVNINQPLPEVVEAVKMLLRLAEAGDLRSLVYMASRVNGEKLSGIVFGNSNPLDMLAVLSRMQHQVNERLDEAVTFDAPDDVS